MAVPKKLKLIYEFKSVASRAAKVRGIMNLQEDQTVLISTGIGFSHNVVERLYWPGTSVSKNLYPIVLPSNDDPCVWRETRIIKTKSIYGPDNIHGNPSGSYNRIEHGEEYKSKDGKEPTFWFH